MRPYALRAHMSLHQTIYRQLAVQDEPRSGKLQIIYCRHMSKLGKLKNVISKVWKWSGPMVPDTVRVKVKMSEPIDILLKSTKSNSKFGLTKWI